MVTMPDSAALANKRARNHRWARIAWIVVAVALVADLVAFGYRPTWIGAASIAVASFSLMYSRRMHRQADRFYAEAIWLTDTLAGILRFKATMVEARLAGWSNDELRSLAKVYPPPVPPAWFRLDKIKADLP